MEVHSWEEAPDGDRTVDNRAAVWVVVAVAVVDDNGEGIIYYFNV